MSLTNCERYPGVKISSDMFEAYLKCSTKCWLLATGEPFSCNTYAEWLKAQNNTYRTIETERLIADSPNREVARWSAVENVLTTKWRLIINLVTHARNLETCIHTVERIPSEGRGQYAKCIPIRYYFANKLTRDHKLLLAFDALVLSEMLSRKVGIGKIIHGDDRDTLKVRTSALMGEVLKLTVKIAKLLSSTSPPDLILNRHCAELRVSNPMPAEGD